MESLLKIFSRNCQVLLGPKNTPNGYTVYPVDNIIWQHAPDFYKWYMAETGIAKVSTLTFELFDVNLKLEKAFSFPVGDLHYFQMLKQCIWDTFWVVSELNNVPGPFKILIKPSPHLDDQTLPRSPVVARQDATKAMTSALLTGQSTAPRFENARTVPHSQSPDRLPQDTSPPDHTEATTHQTPSTPPPRPNNIATASQRHFPPPQRNSGTLVEIATQIPNRYQPKDVPQSRDPSNQWALTNPPLAPEISVRLQIDGVGKVSVSYSKWVLRPKITSRDFFAWFASQTGRGGNEGPPSLRFTFKDAMPCSMSSTIVQANEDHFNLLKRELRTQFERAKDWVPNLKEFVVFVADPGWVLKEDGW